MGKYRTRLQIIAEILEIVKEGSRKTHIMYKANLSYRLLCKYLNDVLESGLARFDEEDHYIVAPRGEKFLKRFHAYRELQDQVRKDLREVDKEKVQLEQMYTLSTTQNRRKGLP